MHDAPENFSEFSAGHRTRTAGNILAHICDLLDWACSMARGTQTWKDVPPRSWNEDVDRFFAGLKRLDSLMAMISRLDSRLRSCSRVPSPTL